MTEAFVQNEKTGKWSIPKDPDAVLDYVENWAPWLDAVGDSIASASVVAIGSDASSNVNVNGYLVNGKTVVAWISGGVAGETVAVRYRITTTNSPARVDDRTCYLKIKER